MWHHHLFLPYDYRPKLGIILFSTDHTHFVLEKFTSVTRPHHVTERKTLPWILCHPEYLNIHWADFVCLLYNLMLSHRNPSKDLKCLMQHEYVSQIKLTALWLFTMAQSRDNICHQYFNKMKSSFQSHAVYVVASGNNDF